MIMYNKLLGEEKSTKKPDSWYRRPETGDRYASPRTQTEFYNVIDSTPCDIKYRQFPGQIYYSIANSNSKNTGRLGTSRPSNLSSLEQETENNIFFSYISAACPSMWQRTS